MPDTKILIADDDEMFLNLLAFKLQKEGCFQIYTAPDGKKAKQLAAEVRPDIVITDVLMPIASGLELIEHIRTGLKLNSFVVAISTLGLEMNMQEALDLGADDFMAKPINLEELIIKVKNLSPTKHP